MEDERSKARLEEQDQSIRYAKIEQYWEKELSIPIRDQEEARLRLHCIRDELTGETDAEPQKLSALKEEFEKAGKIVCHLQLEKKKALDEVSLTLDPLRSRLLKLESGMRQVRQEAEHLSQNRQKKFRELAHHFYKEKLEQEQFGARFALLDHLRSELANNHKPPHTENLAITRKEENGISWNWLLGLAVAIIFVGIHFRAQFYQQAGALASVSRGLHQKEISSLTLFADLTMIDRKKLDTDWPDLASLPAGDALFNEISRKGIQQIAISRNADGLLHYFGLKTRTAIANFGQRLVRRGWTRQPTILNFQAFTDEENIWLVLGPREYLLLPVREFSNFQDLEIAASTKAFWLEEKIKPFDNNSPLLQGFDQLTVKVDQDRFAIELSGSLPISDQSQRKELLERLTENTDISGFEYQMDQNRLAINGLAQQFEPDHFSGEKLALYISELVNNLAQNTIKPELEFETGQSEISQSYITVMTGARSSLHYEGSFSAGITIGDLTWLDHNQILLATDEKARVLKKWKLREGTLSYDDQLLFGKGSGRGLDAPFNPSSIIVAPKSNLVAVLEKMPFFRRNPRIAVIDTEDLAVKWMIDLPDEVGQSLSGAWNQEGNTLVVGCGARRMRGKSSLAVLLYHFEDGEPRLFQLIDLPHDRLAPPKIPNLAWNTRLDQLFLYQEPNQKLIRYALDRTSDAILETMPFGLRTVDKSDIQPQLLLNRTGDRGLILGAGPSEAYLHLIAFDKTEMTLLDRFTPGFRPTAIQRITMTDRFWITGRDKGTVAIVRIEGDKLELESQITLTNFQPGLLASDSSGDLLFLETTYRPAPAYE